MLVAFHNDSPVWASSRNKKLSCKTSRWWAIIFHQWFFINLKKWNSGKFPLLNFRTSSTHNFLNNFLKSTPMFKLHFPWMMHWIVSRLSVSWEEPWEPSKLVDWSFVLQYGLAFLGELREKRFPMRLELWTFPSLDKFWLKTPKGRKFKSHQKHQKLIVRHQHPSWFIQIHSVPSMGSLLLANLGHPSWESKGTPSMQPANPPRNKALRSYQPLWSLNIPSIIP